MADPLTPRQRATKVLASQGWAVGMLDSFPADVHAALAELCDEDGKLAENARDGAKQVIDEYHDSQKATVDGGFGAPVEDEK